MTNHSKRFFRGFATIWFTFLCSVLLYGAVQRLAIDIEDIAVSILGIMALIVVSYGIGVTIEHIME